MLKEFRNKHKLHSSRVFETTIAADMSMKVITSDEEIVANIAMKGKFITDTLKTRISTNLNELHATTSQRRSLYQSNGCARNCGKNPVHCGLKSRCIKGRNRKCLSLYRLGLLPCSLASGSLARQQSVNFDLCMFISYRASFMEAI